MNYRVDGRVGGTKKYWQVLSVAGWCQKVAGCALPAEILFALLPLKKRKHALYPQELGWKISKRNPSDRYCVSVPLLFQRNIHAWKAVHRAEK